MVTSRVYRVLALVCMLGLVMALITSLLLTRYAAELIAYIFARPKVPTYVAAALSTSRISRCAKNWNGQPCLEDVVVEEQKVTAVFVKGPSDETFFVHSDRNSDSLCWLFIGFQARVEKHFSDDWVLCRVILDPRSGLWDFDKILVSTSPKGSRFVITEENAASAIGPLDPVEIANFYCSNGRRYTNLSTITEETYDTLFPPELTRIAWPNNDGSVEIHRQNWGTISFNLSQGNCQTNRGWKGPSLECTVR